MRNMIKRWRSRKTDPATSHQAEAQLTEARVTAVQWGIMRVLEMFGPKSDSQIIDLYNDLKAGPRSSNSGLRTRRAELVAMGLVHNTGAVGVSTMGRRAILWEHAAPNKVAYAMSEDEANKQQKAWQPA